MAVPKLKMVSFNNIRYKPIRSNVSPLTEIFWEYQAVKQMKMMVM